MNALEVAGLAITIIGAVVSCTWYLSQDIADLKADVRHALWRIDELEEAHKAGAAKARVRVRK